MTEEQWFIPLMLAYICVWCVGLLSDLILMVLLERRHPETWVRIGGPNLFRPGFNFKSRRTYNEFMRSRDGEYPRLRLFIRLAGYVFYALFAAVLIAACFRRMGASGG